jgi:membrane protease YdiL (CAAX protease family)
MTFLLDPKNRLFELARSGKRLTHVVLAVVLTVVFMLISKILAMPLLALLSVATGKTSIEALQQIIQDQDFGALVEKVLFPTTALEATMLLVLSFAPAILILWGWLAWIEKRPFGTIGLEASGAVQKFLRGLLVGLLLFVASIGILAAFGFIAIEEGGSTSPQGLAALGGVLLVFVGWVVQGSTEEILSRGWLLQVAGARYKPLWGILISGLIFAALHATNPNISLMAMLNLSLFGIFIALYVLYEGGLWGACGIHAMWNWAQGNIFGFEVSGGEFPGGALFNLMEVGPDVVTGGSFGPEGGLAVSAVLVIGCVLVWMFSRRKTNVLA